MHKGLTATVLALAVMFGITLTVAAQAGMLELLGGDTVDINCDGDLLVLDQVSDTQATANCEAAAAPTPTPTPEPGPDPDPASVPLCPTHDPTQWHALYDAERNCRYDHEHKDNPHFVNDLFGPVGAWHGGQELSYAWQTPHENEMKHQGYGWLVRRDILTDNPKPYGGQNPLSQCKNGWCLSDFRTQFHAIMGPMGAVTRFHSFSMEARICREDMSDCGFVRTGGWIDFGHLVVNSDRNVVPLAGDPPTLPDSGAIRPVRLHCFGNVGCQETSATWYGFHREPPGPDDNPKQRGDIIQTYGLLGETWAPVNPDNPTETILFCPDYNCKWNGSRMEAHLFAIYIGRKFDQDGDGMADFRGYTNRYGTPVEGCTEPGLDCVPTEIVNVPIKTQFQYRDDTHKVPMVEYDSSPPDESWIKYPN